MPIISRQKGQRRHFTYDANGNRNSSGYTVAAGNRITNDGTWTYTYNADEQRTKKSKGASLETWTYQYDLLGHLTRVEKRSSDGGTLLQRIDYAYDALGNRIRRTVYDGSLNIVQDQKFGYDGWDTALASRNASASGYVAPAGTAPDNSAFNVWADLNASDNSLQTRRLFGNSYDAEIARISSAGTLAWYVQDRQNTVRYLTDASGTVQATIVYDGYGNQTSNSNSTFTDRYGYTGRELELYAPHLINYRGNTYALDLGRWTATDAWKQNANNLTVYVFNAPTNGRDPSGYEPLDKPLKSVTHPSTTPPFSFPSFMWQNGPSAVAESKTGKTFGQNVNEEAWTAAAAEAKQQQFIAALRLAMQTQQAIDAINGAYGRKRRADANAAWGLDWKELPHILFAGKMPTGLGVTFDESGAPVLWKLKIDWKNQLFGYVGGRPQLRVISAQLLGTYGKVKVRDGMTDAEWDAEILKQRSYTNYWEIAGQIIAEAPLGGTATELAVAIEQDKQGDRAGMIAALKKAGVSFVGDVAFVGPGVYSLAGKGAKLIGKLGSRAAAEQLAADLGKVGCFVAGTPCWVSSPVLAAVAAGESADWSAGDQPTFESVEAAIPIEEVSLGQHVPSRSPRRDDVETTSVSDDHADWRTIALEVQHANGAMVDVQLLRSEEWIERNGLRVGESFDLRLTEIELDASAFVHSIEDGPEILPGDGAIVTGRFATRQGSDLVRVTFEDGTQLTGTSVHPVWSPVVGDWRGLGEFEPGQFVQTREGLTAIATIEHLSQRAPVYNIEVEGEHVYEVTSLGVMVHNGTAFDCGRYVELYIKHYKGVEGVSALTAAERKEFANLIKEVRKIDFGAYLTATLGGAPETMLSPHAHHILQKLARAGDSRSLVAEGMDILIRNGVPPKDIVFGLNLVWAPNIKGQHTKEAITKVVEALQKAEANGGGADAMKKALERLGQEAAQLK